VVLQQSHGQLEHELTELNFQKYAISQFCSSRSQLIIALTKLQSHGITEEQIISMSKFIESKSDEFLADL
jgi:hypothetical protein